MPVVRPSLVIRLLAVVCGAALGLALLPSVGAREAGAEEGGSPVSAARAGGGDRYDTAAQIAQLTFDESRGAVLASGEDFPDALAASFAAGRIDGPVLLTAQDTVPQPTWDALDALDVSAVVLVGGTGAISDDVESSLADAGYDVARIAGADRFATAAAVARAYGDEAMLGTVDGDRTAVLASGADFPDALSAGPLAAAARLPLLLTPPGRTVASVDDALEELGIERLLVIGGPGAVGPEVVAAYAGAGYEVERLAGATRTETAAVVARHAVGRFPAFTRRGALLARGDGFPDALAASVQGARLGVPLLLTATPTALSSETRDWLEDACPEVEFVQALGGAAALSEQTLAEAVDAAGACLGPIGVFSSFTTPLRPGQARNHNIHLAADYIDGDVIASGDEYSLSEGIGPTTRERGFRENGFIAGDGETISVVGGGVSQIATTFVNTAWFAGVHLAQFRPHTIYFERYPMCREATLVRGHLDVVVVNDLPHDITIATSHDETQVTISFVGFRTAHVESWTSEPYNIEGPGGAFRVDCGRTIHYPDGTTSSESYSWRYNEGYPG